MEDVSRLLTCCVGFPMVRHIVFAADNNFATPLKVAVFSYLRSNPEPTIIHVIQEELSRRHICDLEKLVLHFHPEKDGSKVVVHSVPKEVSFASRESCTVTAKATCYRYLIPNLLKECSRVLYLDCDLMLRGNLRELFSWDLEQKCLAGCRDGHVAIGDWGREIFDKYGVDDYINAGVLLLNLDQLRKEGVVGDFLRLDAENHFPYRDQDVINIATQGRRSVLPGVYNVTSSDGEVKGAFICHFTGEAKPWYYPERGCYCREWEEARLDCFNILGIRATDVLTLPLPQMSMLSESFVDSLKKVLSEPKVGFVQLSRLIWLYSKEPRYSFAVQAYLRRLVDMVLGRGVRRLMLRRLLKFSKKKILSRSIEGSISEDLHVQ